MAQTYDFIVVGGGTAGCHIARRLADTKSKPSVALIEAGPDLRDTCSLAPCDRYNNPAVPDASYGYLTAPQTSLGGQQYAYYRGKGLGGSSALNFQAWCRGSSEDYDYWSEVVEDEAWAWENVKERYKRIEKFHDDIPEDMRRYANSAPHDNGTDGPVDICLPPAWELGAKEVLDAAVDVGMKLNGNLNSGDPIGVGFSYSTSDQKQRSTSATANLTNPPHNLSIIQETPIHKVLFDGKKAIGVQSADGRTFFGKEIILTLGSIDTPKLMMLSGVGSAEELRAFDIPVVHDVPAVGKGLQDHFLILMSCDVAPGLVDKYYFEANAEANKSAREQYAKDLTGPATVQDSTLLMAYLKDDALYDHPAFGKFDKRMQEFIKHPKVPDYEIVLFNCISIPPGRIPPPPNAYFTMVPINHGVQSRGAISLASADPSVPAIINPNFLGDEAGWDRAVILAAVKKTFEFVKSPRVAKYFVNWTYAPKDDSDEEINKFLKTEGGPVWHACCTTRMGKADDPTAVVDTAGRVYGLENLRIADLSVCPRITSNHTQPVAYLIAQTIAEKMIEEYKL